MAAVAALGASHPQPLTFEQLHRVLLHIDTLLAHDTRPIRSVRLDDRRCVDLDGRAGCAPRLEGLEAPSIARGVTSSLDPSLRGASHGNYATQLPDQEPDGDD